MAPARATGSHAPLRLQTGTGHLARFLPPAIVSLSLLAISLSPVSASHRLQLLAALLLSCSWLLIRTRRSKSTSPVRMEILPGGEASWWLLNGSRLRGVVQPSAWSSALLTVISARNEDGRYWFVVPAAEQSQYEYRRLRCCLRFGRWTVEENGGLP
jgi:hypothetical protein